jgi:hypothetical protein
VAVISPKNKKEKTVTKNKTMLFEEVEFTATEYATSADKKVFARKFVDFIKTGFLPHKFTKSFYTQLSMTFEHIAHYNQAGFYSVWFSSPASRVEFIKHTLACRCSGYPEYTFSDVEKVLQKWIKEENVLGSLVSKATEEARYSAVAKATDSILSVGGSIDRKLIGQVLSTAVENVKSATKDENLDENRLVRIADSFERKYCIKTILFRLAAISENANSFGHHGHIFVARNGECWQMSGYRGTIKPKIGDGVEVPVKNGVPQWGQFGFEIPEQMGNASSEQISSVW